MSEVIGYIFQVFFFQIFFNKSGISGTKLFLILRTINSSQIVIQIIYNMSSKLLISHFISDAENFIFYCLYFSFSINKLIGYIFYLSTEFQTPFYSTLKVVQLIKCSLFSPCNFEYTYAGNIGNKKNLLKLFNIFSGSFIYGNKREAFFLIVDGNIKSFQVVFVSFL